MSIIINRTPFFTGCKKKNGDLKENWFKSKRVFKVLIFCDTNNYVYFKVIFFALFIVINGNGVHYS